MKIRQRFTSLLLAATLPLGIAGCGSETDGTDGAAASVLPGGASAEGAMTLAANGPDLCFKSAAEKLGQDARISVLSTSFGVGEDLEKYTVVSTPPGTLKSCTFDYQDPNDSRKLLRMSMDVATGEFGEPMPVEITVMGDANEFSLDDYVIPISQINTSALTSRIDEQKADLEAKYSSHALSMIRLMQPGPGRAEHELLVNFEGRLKSNDIIDSSSIGLKTDGSLDFSNIKS